MVCEGCNQETKGIKINGKLFCTNCGEALNVGDTLPPSSVPTSTETITANDAKTDIEPSLTDKEGQRKTLSDIEKDVEVMEAEEEILDAIIKANKEPEEVKTIKKKSNQDKSKDTKIKEIVKHNRARVKHHHEKDFILVDGEPNPIRDPELEFPHDMELEENKVPLAEPDDREEGFNLAEAKDNVGLALVDEHTKKEIKEKNQRHTEVLANFLKSGASQASQNKHKKEKGKGRWKLALAVGIPIFIIISFIGLVLYVNQYGNKAEPAIEKAESVSVFGFKGPAYVPAGYVPTYLTSGTSDSINYDYAYSPDKAKKLNIIISKTDLTPENIFKEKIVPLEKSFSEFKKDDLDYWIVDSRSLYFVANNLLYEIVSSDKISEEELIKIADGLL